MSIWIALNMAGLALGCLLACRSLIHYFQLESYQFPGWFRTLKRNWIRALLPGLLMQAAWLLIPLPVSLLIPDTLYALQCIVQSLLLAVVGFCIACVMKRGRNKKPLNFTPRVKRLYVITFIVFWLLILLFRTLGISSDSPAEQMNPIFYILVFWPLLLPLWFALAALVAWPVEKAISEMYFRDAQRILKTRPDLIRIGITGSWGKTSLKFILGTLLQEKYNTLITPASFNTPMGVTKVIRSKLEPGHRVFVAEMGARHVGDIREMCRLVHPDIGIITTVGPQHLDTFKTVERVASTKYELMEAIPENGCCFFGDDGDICRGLWQKTVKARILAGTDPATDDVWAEELQVSAEGSRFMLCTEEQRIPVETRLLGEHNISNIVLASAVCLHLGLSPRQIAAGIAKLKPVEHRLQLISRPGCMTVIDDAFNSNINGAKRALEVLRGFTGRRIVVTPGMVELGNEEAALNRELGRKMASCVDLAILVGDRHTLPIAEGLRESNFPETQIRTVHSLEQATELLKSMATPEDTVLFENDLPDNYTE